MKPIYLTFFWVLLLVLAGCDLKGGNETGAVSATEVIQAGELQVQVGLQHDPPTVGENTLLIHVKDQQGKALNDATVRAVAEMPAMGSMPAMRSAANMQAAGEGRYKGTFDLPMKGEWPLAVDIAWEDESGQNQHVDLVFDMATGREGLALVSAPAAGEIAYHTCSMHPSVKSTTPGTCPICGMDLVPVTREEQSSVTIRVDEDRRQSVGIKIGEVVHKPFHFPLRLQGKIAFDQSRVKAINLQYGGWVSKVRALEPGQRFNQGEALFSLYSPELFALQEAHYQSYRRNPTANSPTLQASRERLRLAGLLAEQIQTIERKGAQSHISILAPQPLVIVSSQLTEGAAVQRGQSVLQTASIDQVWVEAYAYERDIPLLQEGMSARVKPPNSGVEKETSVDLISPFVSGATRSARVRLSLQNSDETFMPGQFADVWLYKRLGEQLLVPLDAVVVAGDRRIVFKDLGEGKLQPVKVETGYNDGQHIVIRKGLKEGDRIVTSGVFLIAAESKLKLGSDAW